MRDRDRDRERDRDNKICFKNFLLKFHNPNPYPHDHDHVTRNERIAVQKGIKIRIKEIGRLGWISDFFKNSTILNICYGPNKRLYF